MKLLCLSQDESIEQKVQDEAGRLSWSVVCVHDRQALPEAVEQHNPDMLLIDWSHDGQEWLKSTGLASTCPVVFFTNLETEDMTAALESGADGMVPKPMFTSRFFEARVRTVMRRKGSQVKRVFPRLNLEVDLE